jgi:hypothetical protein
MESAIYVNCAVWGMRNLAGKRANLVTRMHMALFVCVLPFQGAERLEEEEVERWRGGGGGGAVGIGKGGGEN